MGDMRKRNKHKNKTENRAGKRAQRKRSGAEGMTLRENANTEERSRTLGTEEMAGWLALSLGQATGVRGAGGCAGDFHLESCLSISPAVRGNARSRQDKTQSEKEAWLEDKTAPTVGELGAGCQQARQP